jgi:hypothetical protein
MQKDKPTFAIDCPVCCLSEKTHLFNSVDKLNLSNGNRTRARDNNPSISGPHRSYPEITIHNVLYNLKRI